ncbi:MAG: hypothetical protein K4571_16675 [Deltaproteobacteria bacterium]
MRNVWLCIAFGIILAAGCPPASGAGNNAAAGEQAARKADDSDARGPSPADKAEWVKRVTRQHSPASWDLLMEYDHLPPELESSKKGGWVVSMKKPVETFPSLQKDNRRTEHLDRMALHLHVITLSLQRLHAFRYTRDNNILLDWDRAEAFFYLSPARTFYVSFPMKSLYPAADLIPVIPASLKTPLFDAYLRDCKNAQRFGVIGLLEEFHGYYAEARFYADMLAAYRVIEGSDADGFLEWVMHSQSSIGAFYEFDFFILEYLLYMKQRHAPDYEALKSCQPFVETYGAIRSLYSKLIDQYVDTIRAEARRLTAAGKAEVGYDDNILWVRTAGSNKGTRIFTEREKLAPVMNSNRYAAIVADFLR